MSSNSSSNDSLDSYDHLSYEINNRTIDLQNRLNISKIPSNEIISNMIDDILNETNDNDINIINKNITTLPVVPYRVNMYYHILDNINNFEYVKIFFNKVEHNNINDDCYICMNHKENMVGIPCLKGNHYLCLECYCEWYKNNYVNCVVCNIYFEHKDVTLLSTKL